MLLVDDHFALSDQIAMTLGFAYLSIGDLTRGWLAWHDQWAEHARMMRALRAAGRGCSSWVSITADPRISAANRSTYALAPSCLELAQDFIGSDSSKLLLITKAVVVILAARPSTRKARCTINEIIARWPGCIATASRAAV